MNPDCEDEIILPKTPRSLADKAAEAILYKTDNSDMGLQFFKNCRGLFPFGMHEIAHCLSDIDNFPV